MLAFEAPWASVFSYCIVQIIVRWLWLNVSFFFFLLVSVTRSYCVAQADVELM